MKFDKSKVYTALNADESLIGAKGYFDDDLARLRDQVVNEFTRDLKEFKEIERDYYIKSVNSTHIYNFFYLVEPAPIYYVLQDRISGFYQMPTRVFQHDGYQCVFRGSLNECNNYITKHSKPKYRPFKDCDELIETYEKKTGFEAVKHLNMPTIWVKHKNGSNKYLIIAMTDNVVVLYNSHTFDMQELFEQYTFLDGSHCGVEC